MLVGKLKAEGNSDVLNVNNGMRIKKIKTGVQVAPIESKRPQILSDQASGMTFPEDSSQVTDTNENSQNQLDTQRSNFRESKRKSDKVSNKIKIKKETRVMNLTRRVSQRMKEIKRKIRNPMREKTNLKKKSNPQNKVSFLLSKFKAC